MAKKKRKSPAKHTPTRKPRPKPTPKKRAPARLAPKKHAAPIRRVTRSTREKLSKQRLAYVRTGLRKAERELARAVAKVQRLQKQWATLHVVAVRRQSAAHKTRATWAAVRRIAAEERIPLPEARAIHKTRLAAAKEAAKHRPPARWVWNAPDGTEEYVFALKDTVPDMPGRFPSNLTALCRGRLEYWPSGNIFRGEVITEFVTVPFNTGSFYDEFWRNYHDAWRPFIDAFLTAQGIIGERKTKTPEATAYSIASIQAA